LRASFATCPFVKECPFLPEISRKIPFSAASLTSSSVISPGWAKMSAPPKRAERLVPSSTGSTRVSP